MWSISKFHFYFKIPNEIKKKKKFFYKKECFKQISFFSKEHPSMNLIYLYVKLSLPEQNSEVYSSWPVNL